MGNQEPGTYHARPVTIRAIQFNGHNADLIATLIKGAGTVIQNDDGTLELSGRRHRDRVVHPGWWVSRHGDIVTIHGTEAFADYFEPS